MRFLIFSRFFRGHQKKSRVFLWFSSMKNHGKTQGDYWRTLGKPDKFFGGLEKNREKIENLKNFLYFQLSSYLIKRSCNFHRQTPNGDEAVIKNPFFFILVDRYRLHSKSRKHYVFKLYRRGINYILPNELKIGE